jgi:preprotein translocase subunit Sss1
MNPDVLRSFLRAGILVSVMGILLVLAVPRDSAEFVVSVCSAAIGLTLTGLVVVAIRLSHK